MTLELYQVYASVTFNLVCSGGSHKSSKQPFERRLLTLHSPKYFRLASNTKICNTTYPND